jgi:hypothetical protein
MFISGVNDTGDKLFGGVNDTADKSFGSKGGTHCLGKKGRGKLIRTKGKTFWYSRYSKIPLRKALTATI